MELSVVAALGSSTIALIAAGIAVWQAISASRQARYAGSQLEEARRATDTAILQLNAELEQQQYERHAAADSSLAIAILEARKWAESALTLGRGLYYVENLDDTTRRQMEDFREQTTRFELAWFSYLPHVKFVLHADDAQQLSIICKRILPDRIPDELDFSEVQARRARLRSLGFEIQAAAASLHHKLQAAHATDQ